MQYTILVYETAEGFAARSDPTQQQAYWAGTMNYLRALKEAGVFVAGAGLQPPDAATQLRHEAGRMVVQDGPVVETREMLGGFFIITAPDLDAALHWAGRFPDRPGVAVEVRPNLSND